MQQTSLQAYSEAKKDLNRKQVEVFRAIEDIYPATNLQISKHLGWAINSVTPRVLELRGKYKVVEAYKDIDPMTGRRSIFWKPAKISKPID